MFGFLSSLVVMFFLFSLSKNCVKIADENKHVRVMFYRKSPVYQKLFFRVTFLSLLALLAVINSPAQDQAKVDSLRKLLGKGSKTDQFDSMYGLGYELFDKDNVQAIGYVKDAYKLAREIGDSLRIVKSGTTYGQLMRRFDKLEEAIEITEEMLAIAKRHKFAKETGLLLNSMAIAYTFRAE